MSRKSCFLWADATDKTALCMTTSCSSSIPTTHTTYFLTLKLEAVSASETSVPKQQTRWCHTQTTRILIPATMNIVNLARLSAIHNKTALTLLYICTYNEKMNQPTNKPTNHLTCQPANQPTKQPANQPTKQPTTWPASQPTNQPTD